MRPSCQSIHPAVSAAAQTPTAPFASPECGRLAARASDARPGRTTAAPLGPTRCIRCIGTTSTAYELPIGPRSTIVAIAMRQSQQCRCQATVTVGTSGRFAVLQAHSTLHPCVRSALSDCATGDQGTVSMVRIRPLTPRVKVWIAVVGGRGTRRLSRRRGALRSGGRRWWEFVAGVLEGATEELEYHWRCSVTTWRTGFAVFELRGGVEEGAAAEGGLTNLGVTSLPMAGRGRGPAGLRLLCGARGNLVARTAQLGNDEIELAGEMDEGR